jgi:hypothetical protein
MAAASTEIPGTPGDKSLIEPGIHAAYFFEFQSEKQLKLFSLCREAVDEKNASLVYIAGKQGVKGIRLSLKDTGFDVAAYEKKQQMKILDSEEFFLAGTRQQQFRPMEELTDKIKTLERESLEAGFASLLMVSETDMLVRKGYLPSYKGFDEAVGDLVSTSSATMLCAFDRRELSAKGISNPEADIGPLHTVIV